jgi:uncharacterized membrane protein
MMLEVFRPFPTLHPLIVHLPVVLIPLAPLLLLAAWGWRNKALEWITVALLALGWAGAVAASRLFHPHTDAMTLLAQDALRLHELWADWTQGLAGVGLVLLVLHNISTLPKTRAALKLLIMLLGLGAAAAVALAGHYGAMLTHVYKVTVEHR